MKRFIFAQCKPGNHPETSRIRQNTFCEEYALFWVPLDPVYHRGCDQKHRPHRTLISTSSKIGSFSPRNFVFVAAYVFWSVHRLDERYFEASMLFQGDILAQHAPKWRILLRGHFLNKSEITKKWPIDLMSSNLVCIWVRDLKSLYSARTQQQLSEK